MAINKCSIHRIGYLGSECPKCKKGIPAVKGRQDRGKTPLLRLGGIKKQRVYGKA